MRERRILVLAVLALGSLVACRGEATGEPTLSIQTPAEGDSISGPVRLSISVDGAQIGPPETGNMHVHVYVDDSGEYEVVTSTQTTLPLSGGDHTLRVVLAQPNHDETGTSDSVSVSVAGGAAPTPATEETGGGGAGETDGDTGGGGYNY